ncbi:hypothetical protein HNQ51_002342 [Inhella inkyongensis]|uniref:Uncharacterized protein n=1 Tax=Inhella inkyongensis TaxID=392593 RepID=A0A840S5P3_9BURK|nr:hypothetical protein [Inhella inkyongensis]MBB5205023.1 hypothetical protein [Inhella inkyongensis]
MNRSLLGLMATGAAGFLAGWLAHGANAPAAQASPAAALEGPAVAPGLPAAALNPASQSAWAPQPGKPVTDSASSPAPHAVVAPVAPAAKPGLSLMPAPTLSAEHQALLVSGHDKQPFRNASPAELHQQFMAEARDATWADPLETQLRQALGALGVQSPAFDVQGLDCRQNLCELRLIGFAPNAGDQWNRAMVSLREQDWWGQAYSGMSTTSSGNNGRTVIATFFERRKR